ncbi:unnamed protein product [Rotaria sordida]|uniref:Uncharacterized protein n=1 Tax=Rotaria sordida TaxID=392033 RepID=A0A814JVS2_9BILA|nr:unnamed protein product [Rotaria sordida]CAF1255029.1 unnamed protein product [Rotaria sordida]
MIQITKHCKNWQYLLFILHIYLFFFVQIHGQRLEIKRNIDDVNSDQFQSLYVPLKKVYIETTIHSFAADVTIIQVFRNDENKPIEAIYCFPIEEQAAIYSFVARINDREIIAQLKEKKVAQKEYVQALRENHGAYLLEQDEKSQDNFIINVGALPPSTECTITISYVTELDLIDGFIIRFVIPTTIAPRYDSKQGGISSPASTNSKYVQKSPYTIKFYCLIKKIVGETGELIRKVSSSSHPIKIDFNQQDAYVVTFDQENTQLDRDILINIELAEKQVNTILTIESNAVMATFIPSEEDCRQARNSEETNEFIFIVDCSGSMTSDNKIGLTREAVMLFLKSLPDNSQFNIIRFGSDFTALFSEITVVYNKANIRQAQQMVTHMQANLGGTELLAPLQWLKRHPPVKGRSRQIFLLTDGEISDVSAVLDLCRSMASSTRIFSFGLGMSPSRALVKGLARATNGRFVFIPPNSRVDVYVKEQLHRALQPSITNVQVKWNFGEIDVHTAPTQLPPVYANDRLIIYGLMDNISTLPSDVNLSVELYTKEDHHRLGEARIERISSIDNKGSIARLAAKALILELQHAKKAPTGSLQSRFQDETDLKENTTEMEETTKKRIIELSLNYSILTPYTAFVGIEKRMNQSNIDMVLREVPIQVSADDQHLILSSMITNKCDPSSGKYSGSLDFTFNQADTDAYTA